MLGDTNLYVPHEVETLRRSVAMLPANTRNGILTREETLRVLDALAAAIRDRPVDAD